MSLFFWPVNQVSTRSPRRRARRQPAAATFRPHLEALEDRTLPSTYYAATASDLIADINAANKGGGANTIVLTAPTTSPYVLTAVNNTANGANMLPVIKKHDSLTIVTGNGTAKPAYGDVIDASHHGRLFDVANGASLTLENVTLQNGQAAIYNSAEGGAIFNQGTLVLSEVMITNNTADAQPDFGQDAAGGGVWSNGSLTVENSCVFQGNSAMGSDDQNTGLNGGNAFGGAIYIAGGTANVTNSFFGAYSGSQGNSAVGGYGGPYSRDGSGYGGAIYVAAGTVTMSADTVGNPPGFSGASSNIAQGPSLSLTGYGYGGGLYVAGGSVTLTNDYLQYNVAGGFSGGGVAWAGGYGSSGYGGGIFIASGATVYLDSFTVANTINDTANWFPNIDGTYILLP
jgi:hypothetical protein